MLLLLKAIQDIVSIVNFEIMNFEYDAICSVVIFMQ